jgi:hypothetical protein
MDNSYTHITLVSDRSGSMADVRSDAEGAINFFIDEQKAVEGKATLYFVEFDAQHDDWYRTVHKGDLQAAPHYHLEPRNGTALLDAVALAINETGMYLREMPEDERPGKVIFVVQTDGLENSSREHTWRMVADKIKVQSEQFAWEFVFLGQGADSWSQGDQLGIKNVVLSSGTRAAHASTHSVMSAYTTGYRTGAADSMVAANVTVRADGSVVNEAGEEIDPVTGQVKTPTS